MVNRIALSTFHVHAFFFFLLLFFSFLFQLTCSTEIVVVHLSSSAFYSSARLQLADNTSFFFFVCVCVCICVCRFTQRGSTWCFIGMVYAPAAGSGGTSPPHGSPQEARDDENDGHDPNGRPTHDVRETVESLRRAVEIQEARVRLLRARKVAREQLLLRIQSLLATGGGLEVHTPVEHIVRQAEMNFHHLLQTENAVDHVAEEEGEERETNGSSGDASSNSMARIFSRGVEAQLEAVAEDPLVLRSSTNDVVPSSLFDDSLRLRMKTRKATTRKRRAELSTAESSSSLQRTVALAVQGASTAVPSLPHSTATEAFLAKSASRAEAGHAAMLAALESLRLGLESNSEKTRAVSGASQPKTPAWLNMDDEATEVVDVIAADAVVSAPPPPTFPPWRHSASSISSSLSSSFSVHRSRSPSTMDYSDDFEVRSDRSDASDAVLAADAKKEADEEEAHS